MQWPTISLVRFVLHFFLAESIVLIKKREQMDNDGYQFDFCVIVFSWFHFHKMIIIQDDWAVAHTMKWNCMSTELFWMIRSILKCVRQIQRKIHQRLCVWVCVEWDQILYGSHLQWLIQAVDAINGGIVYTFSLALFSSFFHGNDLWIHLLIINSFSMNFFL